MASDFDILTETTITDSKDIKLAKFVLFNLDQDLFGISADFVNQVQFTSKIYPQGARTLGSSKYPYAGTDTFKLQCSGEIRFCCC